MFVLMNVVVFIVITASKVNELGMKFENVLREDDDPRFDFLKASSPYHAWYRRKVKEASSGRDIEAEARAVRTRGFWKLAA